MLKYTKQLNSVWVFNITTSLRFIISIHFNFYNTLQFFMKRYMKTILFCLSFLSVIVLHAQDSVAPIKFKRNAVKFGTSFTVTNYFLSYEHAFTKQFSVGGAAAYNDGYFTGFTGTLFTRYYFKGFDQRGFFAELRGSYLHSDAYVYAGYYFDRPPSASHNSDRVYYGGHKADIDYWSMGLSGGYKIFCSKRFFFEFIGGLHFGKATFGSEDVFLATEWPERKFIADNVRDAFKTSGPGMPFHFMANFGFAF